MGETFRKGIALLHGVANPVVEAKILLMMATGLSDVEILRSPARAIGAAQEKRYFRLVGQRLNGTPLAYLTKKKEFWSLPFKIGPGVLIPRPETELIVETVLALSPGPGEIIADIGTGSGAVAVALGKELPRARIVATDVSAKALGLAKHNASQNGVTNIVFKRGSLFAPLKDLKLDGRCGFIVSNPPYISAADWTTLPAEVRDHEPKRALLGGETGLEFIGKLVRGALAYLKPGGVLVFEIGLGQAEAVLALFKTHPIGTRTEFATNSLHVSIRWTGVGVLPDLQGIPRVVRAGKGTLLGVGNVPAISGT